MSAWISAAQLERDHNGLRNVCAACGHDATTEDPLVVDAELGARVHLRHYTVQGTGYYGRGYR